MAEGLIAARLQQYSAVGSEGRTGSLEIRSAGTWATPDIPPTREAVLVMAERGIDISGIRSEEITTESVQASDLILVMTGSHKEAIEADFASARGKTIRMSELVGDNWDVEDPVGGTVEDYRATARELDRLIEEGWAKIVGSV